MTSAGEAAARSSGVGHRSSQAVQRGTTRSTCVCCSITSETRIAYGSRVFRQGRSRPFSRYQSDSSSCTGRLARIATREVTEMLSRDRVARIESEDVPKDLLRIMARAERLVGATEAVQRDHVVGFAVEDRAVDRNRIFGLRPLRGERAQLLDVVGQVGGAGVDPRDRRRLSGLDRADVRREPGTRRGAVLLREEIGVRLALVGHERLAREVERVGVLELAVTVVRGLVYVTPDV